MSDEKDDPIIEVSNDGKHWLQIRRSRINMAEYRFSRSPQDPRPMAATFETGGVTVERFPSSDEKAEAEQKLIDEAARIAREVGATPDTVDAAIAADRRKQSDEKPRPSPGPWRWRKHGDEIDGRLVDATGRDIIASSIYDGVIIAPADADLIADAWQIPLLREDIEEMRELLRELSDSGLWLGGEEAGWAARIAVLLSEKDDAP